MVLNFWQVVGVSLLYVSHRIACAAILAVTIPVYVLHFIKVDFGPVCPSKGDAIVVK